MDVSGAAAFKTLGVRVVQDGVDQTVAALNRVGDAGEQSGQRVEAAGRRGATGFSNAFIAEAGKAAQAAKQYATTLETTFEAEQGRIKEGIARGFITPAEATKAGRDAAQAYNQGLLGQLDILGAKGLDPTSSKTYIELSNSLKRVDETSVGAGAGLGRVRQGLISLIAQATGTIPVLDRVGGSLSTMAFGGGVTLAVVAGIAAIAFAYEKLTEDSRKAAEEQDKLTAALHDWYVEQQAGPAGKLVADIDAGIAKMRELQAQIEQFNATQKPGSSIANVSAALASPSEAFSVAERFKVLAIFIAQGSDAANKAIREWYAGQVAATNQGSAEFEAAIKAANEKIVKAFQEQQQAEISGLSTIVQAGRATPQQSQLAASLLSDYQRQFDQAQKNAPAPSSGDAFRKYLDDQKRLLEQIKPIEDALHEALLAPFKDMESKWSDAEGIFSVATDHILASLVKQGDGMRSLAAEDGKQAQAATDAARLIGVEGVAREYLTNTITVQRETETALNTLTGVALTTKLADIAATQQQTHENIAHAAAVQDAKDAQKAFNDVMQGAQAIADANIKKTTVQTGEYEKLAAAIEKDLLHAISNFAEHGITSFSSFARDVESLSIRMVGSFTSGIATLSADLKTAIKDGATTQAAYDRDRIASMERMKQLAADIGAALAGAQIGFNVGQQTSSGFNGAGAGAVAGAASGFEIAGPWGAVIGGLTGAVGGLLGAAQAHRDAAKALQDAAKSLAANIAGYATNNALQAALLDNQAKHDALVLQAQQLLDAQLSQAAKDGSKTEVASAFGQFQASIDAITKAYTDNIARLVAAQIEEQRQVQFTLDAREAYAKGLTAEGDLLTRRAAEEKELFDDSVAHYTDAQIAQVKYIQGLEDEAVAKKKLTDASQTLAQNLAAGPSGTLSQQQAADRQPLLDKQASDIAAYNAAVDQLAKDTLAGADAATIAADKQAIYTDSIITAGDAAGIAAKAWQDAVAAINQANSDIAAAVSGGHITGAAGLAAEAANFGFTGLTDAQINALYTDPTKGELTNEQRQTNKNIDQYLADEKQWGPQIAAALSGVADGGASSLGSGGTTNALVNGAQALTEATGNRLADYEASQLIELRAIRRAIEARGGSVFSGNVANLQPVPLSNLIAPALNFAPPPTPTLDPATLSQVVSAVIPRLTLGGTPIGASTLPAGTATPASGITNNFSIRIVQSDGEDSAALARRVADEVQKIMAAQATAQLLRDGNPIKAGV